MERILVLIAADAYVHVDKALRSARDQAARPQRISYGVSLREEPEDADTAAMRELGTVQFVSPAYNSWQDMPALWRGESYVLIAHAGMRFAPNWDRDLLRCLNRCRDEEASGVVLTGFLPTLSDELDAVSPVAAEGFDEEGRLCFRRGVPLCYAKEPVRSAFLHPAFCFGPAQFFQALSGETPPYFLAAFRRMWQLYTLNQPVIRTAWEVPVLPVTLPDDDGVKSGMNAFGTRFAMRLDQRQLSAMARSGLFTADLTFPMHVPVRVRFHEAVREFMNRRSRVTPLCVTAYLSLEVPGESLPDESLSRFVRLAGMKNLSLLCFSSGEMGRRLLPVMPNVMEYKRRYGLPLQVDITPANALNFIKLSKMFLLLQGREKFLNHSHYVWMNFGYLRYPVYDHMAVCWDGLCTEKIVIATVAQMPDPSMIVVPQGMLQPLCQEITRLCSESLARNGMLPQEITLWQQLLKEKPDWFAPVELAATHALFALTMNDNGEVPYADG